MKISLVLATVGRQTELARFLAALRYQSSRDWELIIVDQNPPGFLDDVLNSADVPLVYIRSVPGLSRARNEGLSKVTGDVTGFPDDDCWYGPGVLGAVTEWFARYREASGVSLFCQGVTKTPRRPKSGAKAEPTWITSHSTWSLAASLTLFFRSEVIRRVGQFDESLGVGAGTKWGSGEETDLTLRVMEAGGRILWVPVQVHHPRIIQDYDPAQLAKIYNYSAGMGRVLRLRRRPIREVVYWQLRSLAGVVASLAWFDVARARYYAYVFIGRLRGWCAPLGDAANQHFPDQRADIG